MVGNFRSYTNIKLCEYPLSIGLLNCFFENLVVIDNSACENDCEAKCLNYDPGIVYRGKNWDSPRWWGVIQSYMSRPNTFLKSVFLNKTGLHKDTTFYYSVHIRMGGKMERSKEFIEKGIKFDY